MLAWPTGPNPYQVLIYAALRKRGWEVLEYSRARLVLLRTDVVHLHWPDLVLTERRPALRLLKAAVFVALLWLARARGRQVVWTVHNPMLRAEQATRWGRRYLSLVARACTGLIFLSEGHTQAFGVRADQRPSAVIPHPRVERVYGSPRERSAARVRLGLPERAPVFGFFGHVRPYKELGRLAAAFAEVRMPEARLLVAGGFDPRCRSLAQRLAQEPRTLLIERRVDDAEVPWIVGAMDLVVLPYRELGNSGVAVLALSLGRPVLAPGVKSMQDLQQQVGPAWLHLYDARLDGRRLEEALASLPAPGSKPDLTVLDPERVGDLTDCFLSSLLDREPAPARS